MQLRILEDISNVHNTHRKYALMDYVTGHLEESEINEIRLHLEQCSECQHHYTELYAVHHVVEQTQKPFMSSAYYSSIIPRIQERLSSQRNDDWIDKKVTSAVILPLVVSVLCVVLLTRIPSESLIGYRSDGTLTDAVKDFTSEEVVLAVSNESAGSWISPSQEVVYEGIEEHLRGDSFFREALVQQIDTEEIDETDIGGVLSSMNGEQADLILSGLTERELL
jgi:hypothetical protein